MDCRALSASELPHTSKLIRDYIQEFSKLKPFFDHTPSLDTTAAYAKELEFPPERRREVARILRAQTASFGSNPETAKNLTRLEEGAVAVVTGQQVGLFSGPAYAFYKALTAIQTAHELTREGISAVPVFWMATEDHDVDEVRHTTWFVEGQLRRLQLSKPAENARPVGHIRLGVGIRELVKEAAGTLTGSAAAKLSEILHKSYTLEDTYGSAFAKLFTQIFGAAGLILLDPLDASLHRLAEPVLRRALEQRDELNDALLRRGKELERAGYAAQVKVTSRSTLLFSLQGGKRQVISGANGRLLSGGKTASREEWVRRSAAEPENFSPNALLRPVVQDFLLPTAAYVAGPNEIAYFAQSQVLYENLLGRMPVILPRADFTLVDPKGVRLLKKYRLEIEDVWLGSQELRKGMYSSSVPKELARQFEQKLRQIEKSLQQLHKAIATVDPTIQGSIARAERRIRYQLEKLRYKTGASLDRQEKLIEQHEAFLENLLYPQKGLQSRDLCFLPFLARWGMGGMQVLQMHAGGKKLGQHFVVPIP
jgi:bacillithiol synthase